MPSRELVKAGAVVDASGPETPLVFAIKWSHFEAARALLEAGADPNKKDKHGKTALHYMLKKRSGTGHVRMGIEHGGRLDVKDPDGVTPGSVLSRMRAPEFQKLVQEYC